MGVFSYLSVLLLLSGALASHFRYGTISWRQTGTRVALFKTDQAWRKDFGYSPCGGGSTCIVNAEAITGSIQFPSGTPASSQSRLRITSIDNGKNYFVGTFSVSVTFAGVGPYQVSFYTCCRIGGIRNSPAELATTALVFFPTGRMQSSPVTNVAAIVAMQQNRVNKFLLPASDADLDPIRFTRVAIGNGAGNVNSLTIDPITGLVQWNPGTSALGFYTIVVRMEDFDSRSCSPPVTACAASSKLSDVMVDFFIEVIPNDGNREPVVSVPPTPAAGSSITAAQSEPVSFEIVVTDADNDQITVVPSWSVPDMQLVGALTQASPLKLTFRWTVPAIPNAVNQACFIARDSRGNEAPFHCITIKVGTLTVTAVTNDATGSNEVWADGVGQKVRLTGKNMAGGSSYKCRYQLGNGPLTIAQGYPVSATQMTCDVPNFRTQSGVYTVEGSMDGSAFTSDAKTITLRAVCPPNTQNLCSGQGTCLPTGVCQCTAPFSGPGCEFRCGDGKLAQGESCDDGNTANGDGCSSTCQIEAGCLCSSEPSTCQCCGNGRREGTESCDDGNVAPGDGCSAACNTEGGYTCSTATPNVCQRCGNSYLEGTEGCDDGNVNAGDGCTGTCTVEPGWVCNTVLSGVNADGIQVTYDPTVKRYRGPDNRFAKPLPQVCQNCGNGRREGTEECDDGNKTAGDGCGATCAKEAGWTCTTGSPTTCFNCGNGRREIGEECDLGTTNPPAVNGGKNSGCLSNCRIDAGFECTQGNNGPDTCQSGPGLCGNGELVTPEACDDGNKLSGDGCSSSCQIEAPWDCVTQAAKPASRCFRCGNGVRESFAVPVETCDDGNTTPDDGCSAKCAQEPGFTCTPGTGGAPDVCENCGDGKRQGKETCDDGNAIGGDGCTSCRIDDGYTCSTDTPNVCERCGNGKIEGTEVCDDANTDAGDGCSPTCVVEANWECPPDKRVNGVSKCNVIYDPPLTPGTVLDLNPDSPEAGDADLTATGGQLMASWYGFVDPVEYEFRVGTTYGGSEVVDWTPTSGGNSTRTLVYTANNQLALKHDQQYFITIRSKNSKGKFSFGNSNGIRFDATPPQGGRLVDGVSDDTEWTSVTDSASMFFLPVEDPESGLEKLEYAFGEEGASVASLNFTAIPLTQSAVTVSGLQLQHGGRYAWSLRATNKLGRSSVRTSNGFGVDKVTPSSTGVVIDDGDFQGFAKRVAAKWAVQFNDSTSGLAYVEWSLAQNDPANTTYQFAFANIGQAQSLLMTNEADFLEDKKLYYVTVRAYDKVGLMTSVTSDGFTVDLSPPVKGSVGVGASVEGASTEVSDMTSFPLAWTAWKDPESTISSYSVALTTNASAVAAAAPALARRFSSLGVNDFTDVMTDVYNFTSVGVVTSTKIAVDLSPWSGKSIYAIVRGFNGAGNWADAVVGPIAIKPVSTDKPAAAKKGGALALNTAAGKSILGAGIAAAAVMAAAIIGYLLVKSGRKRALRNKAAATKEAQRKALHRNSTAAVESEEFANIGQATGPTTVSRDPNDEVESAGFA